MSDKNLGQEVSSHAVQPATLQRAAFMAVLSFLFFLAMMFTFYLLQNIIYFLLATAFLLIYIVTMFSLVVQKRGVVRVFEGGITYRKFEARWDEIRSFRSKAAGGQKVRIEIITSDRNVVLPENLQNTSELIREIRLRLPSQS